MIRKVVKLFISSVIISSALSGISYSVNASSFQYGSYGYYTCNGYSYKNRNSISTGVDISNTKYASGMTYVEINESSRNIPAGYAGVYTRVYNSNSALVADSGNWNYTSSGTAGLGISARLNNAKANDSYYCQGSTRAWNGTSYYTYSTFATPSLNDFS